MCSIRSVQAVNHVIGGKIGLHPIAKGATMLIVRERFTGEEL